MTMTVFVMCRADPFHMPGNPHTAAAQHVLHGSAAREGGVGNVLPGRRAVSQLLLALSHGVLPLREGLSHLLQVRPRLSLCCPTALGAVTTRGYFVL